MREQELRKILLVKAIEESDADGTLLPPADRAAAGREAMRAAPGAKPDRLLLARADTLMARIAARHPFVSEVSDFLGPSPTTMWLLLIAGLAIGGGLSVLDGSRRINVLAFPLLGIVAWNLVVYLVLLLSLLRRGRAAATPLRSMPASLGAGMAQRMIKRARGFNAPLAQALSQFAREWFEASRPLLLARAARAFHLAAAAVGVGLIAGLYLRGIAFDYRAGWESTFLDATQARHLLNVLYGPGAWLTTIPVPDVAQLESARWRPDGGGEPAARWIHLMAASALIYVLVPRLLLAVVATLDVTRLSLRAAQPASLQTYFRTAFANIEGAVPRAVALVMPYAAELTPGALARLIAWVPTVAGGPVTVDAHESVPYGEEERYLATFAERGGDAADIVVLPFSLATTPEDENHGAVLAAVRDRVAASKPDARVLVVVDEAPYAARMGGAPERIAERRETWRRFVRAHGLEPTFVTLAA